MEIQTPADSSPAPLEIPSAGSPDYTEWRKTGNLPRPKKADPAPATKIDTSATDTEVDSGEVESASASEADTDTQEIAPRKRSNAEQRIKELLAENKRLKATQPAPKTEVKAESSTAKTETQEAPSTYAEWRAAFKPQPWLEKWAKDNPDKTYEDGILALGDYRDSAKEHFAQIEAGTQKLNSMLEEGGKRYGQDKMADVLQPVANTIVSDPKIRQDVKEVLRESPVIVDLLYVFSQDQAQFDAWIKLARTNPAKAIREAVVLEQLIAEELNGKKKTEATVTAAAETDTVDEDTDEGVQRDPKTGKFLKPPEKKITSAPGPTHEVNATGTAPVDDAQAALEAGDFRRYRDLKNAQDLKKGRKA